MHSIIGTDRQRMEATNGRGAEFRLRSLTWRKDHNGSRHYSSDVESDAMIRYFVRGPTA